MQTCTALVVRDPHGMFPEFPPEKERTSSPTLELHPAKLLPIIHDLFFQRVPSFYPSVMPCRYGILVALTSRVMICLDTPETRVTRFYHRANLPWNLHGLASPTEEGEDAPHIYRLIPLKGEASVDPSIKRKVRFVEEAAQVVYSAPRNVRTEFAQPGYPISIEGATTVLEIARSHTCSLTRTRELAAYLLSVSRKAEEAEPEPGMLLNQEVLAVITFFMENLEEVMKMLDSALYLQFLFTIVSKYQVTVDLETGALLIADLLNPACLSELVKVARHFRVAINDSDSFPDAMKAILHALKKPSNEIDFCRYVDPQPEDVWKLPILLQLIDSKSLRSFNQEEHAEEYKKALQEAVDYILSLEDVPETALGLIKVLINEGCEARSLDPRRVFEHEHWPEIIKTIRLAMTRLEVHMVDETIVKARVKKAERRAAAIRA